ALCEQNQLGVVLCHSHPSDIPYSASDDFGERRIFETLRKFIPENAPTASLLFCPNGVIGRIWIPTSDTPISFSEIIVIGSSINKIRLLDPESISISDHDEVKYDRQIRAFGKEGQSLIASTKVGLVGVGGTGSPTVEQLVRLGIRDIVLIDPDEFEESNITRVYGSFPISSKRSWWPFKKRTRKKIEIVASHLKNINPRVKIKTLPKNVVITEAARTLLDRDVIFLCTDDYWGRSIVNQITYQYLIPTINVGMHIDSENEIIKESNGVIDVLRPDNPCLWCTEFLRSEIISAESMPEDDRLRMQREGYVRGINTPAPSVICFTTALSGMAVSLFIQLITNFMGDAWGNIARINYNIMKGTVRRGQATIKNPCVCQKFKGYGDLKNLPTQDKLNN
ncbi:MAG: ThiF family adenylyltransferase, partial [Candidatus Dadabacteria bacterium]|nr:ThiF family adenylyltransferase [Candidatus Dadabacteria bacterium]